MIPKPIEQLVMDIATNVADRQGCKVPKDLEKWLVSMLLNIKRRISDQSTMLQSTVERGFHDDSIKEAGRLLKRHKSQRANGKGKRKTLASAH